MDMRHGIGRLITKRNIYEGQWKDNKKHGYGREIYNDGSWYLGMWENGKKNGYGVLNTKGE